MLSRSKLGRDCAPERVAKQHHVVRRHSKRVANVRERRPRVVRRRRVRGSSRDSVVARYSGSRTQAPDSRTSVTAHGTSHLDTSAFPWKAMTTVLSEVQSPTRYAN